MGNTIKWTTMSNVYRQFSADTQTTANQGETDTLDIINITDLYAMEDILSKNKDNPKMNVYANHSSGVQYPRCVKTS